MASNTSKRTYGQKTLVEGLVNVPTVVTSVSITDSWIFQITVCNTNNTSQTFFVEDGQAVAMSLVPTITIPGNTVMVMEWEESVKMKKGIQWAAGGTGLTAEIFGFSI